MEICLFLMTDFLHLEIMFFYITRNNKMYIVNMVVMITVARNVNRFEFFKLKWAFSRTLYDRNTAFSSSKSA